MSQTNSKRMTGIMLAGGVDAPVACAEVLARHCVEIRTVVCAPDVPEKTSEAIARKFPAAPSIVVATRPDKHPFILDLLDGGGIDFLFSCGFTQRIRPRLLKGAKIGAVNIHPSLLPHNRGYHTSFWGIMDGTPLGTTIHWMDETLDTGAIIGQSAFEDDSGMSAHEVRQTQWELSFELFDKFLPLILKGEAPKISQPNDGFYHYQRDIQAATSFESSDILTMGEVLRLARATSHETHRFYVQVGNRKFKVQATVSEVTD